MRVGRAVERQSAELGAAEKSSKDKASHQIGDAMKKGRKARIILIVYYTNAIY